MHEPAYISRFAQDHPLVALTDITAAMILGALQSGKTT